MPQSICGVHAGKIRGFENPLVYSLEFYHGCFLWRKFSVTYQNCGDGFVVRARCRSPAIVKNGPPFSVLTTPFALNVKKGLAFQLAHD